MAMVYDELVLQDGRYRLMVAERGSIESVTPPDQVADRTTVNFTPVGTPFSLRIAGGAEDEWHSVVEGAAIANWEADFFPFFSRAGLLGQPYLRWRHIQLNGQATAIVDKEAAADRSSVELQAVLPNGRFLQEAIIKNLYGDSLLSRGLEIPVSLGCNVLPALHWKNREIIGTFRPDLSNAFQCAWCNLGLPDAGEASWDVIHERRQSAAGRDYRRLISRITADVAAILPDSTDPRAIGEAMQQAIVSEVVSELRKRRSKPSDAMLSLGLNFIPVIGAELSALKECRAIIQEGRTWVAVLDGFPARPGLRIRSDRLLN